ncbi:MAG: RHS domain-containing protein [Gammaproteobacteria bacterium]|nr:RHS domain-containing protein [Gammaproteobacteria bacterium]
MIADAIRFVPVGSSYDTYYVHTNHLDAPIALSDQDGVVQWQGSYDPYGNLTTEIDNVTQKLKFPGQYADAETGMHYNYFRDYDPEIGRYLQSDPIGLNGGVNTYGYVLGNPIRYYDPYGLWSFGKDPIPEWIANPLIGLGDGASFGLTRRLRQWGDFDVGYSKCSKLYLGGQLVGGSMPLSRLGYVSKIKQIPSRFKEATMQTAKAAYRQRLQYAAYFRGSFLNRFYRQKHSFGYYAKKNNYDWQKVIDKAGYANPRETRRILALAPSAYARTAIDYSNDYSNGNCGCE